MSPQDSATRDKWKTSPIPNVRAPLEFCESYSIDQFERIKEGLIPRGMEDKWFVFYEAPWLYFHRSWTGSCIYGVRFSKGDNNAFVSDAWVNRDPSQHAETRDDYDRALVKFLIDAFLLGKHVPFPVPGNLPKNAPKGSHEDHH